MTALATLADLLHDLGDISPDRIRLRPPPGTATEQDVLDIGAKENRRFELIDGVLVEKAMGFWESMLAITIASALRSFVVPRKLGVVAGADGALRLFPHLNLIRMPDVAYVSNARLAGLGGVRQPVPQLAPDIAVEVFSEGNTPAEMDRKRREYFDAGVQLVWIVYPNSRTIEVHTSPGSSVTLTEGQTLDGGGVLPGFALELSPLFAELDSIP